MANYKINKDGEVVFQDKNRIVPDSDPLWEEFTKLEYEVLNNHHNPTKDPIKIARYNELKKQLNIEKSTKALGEAMEKAKQQIIAADKSADNSVLYAAMAKFKKRNE
jgi:hypothetical protein